MNADVLSLSGEKKGSVSLPEMFNVDVDRVLIRRAVLAMQSARIQPNGPNPRAGREYTAEYEGLRKKPQMHRTINVGHARLPRMKNRKFILSGQVALVPRAVGGPQAHKLNPEKILKEKINKKERRKALEAAVAATGKAEIVRGRGHKFDEKTKLPLVVDAELEGLEKTKDVREALKRLGVWMDVERAEARKGVRAGKGKKRGRKYKRAKSVLIIVENPEKIYRAARNLEGVEVTAVRNLNIELLAPGTEPGRLTLWSEGAIVKVGEHNG